MPEFLTSAPWLAVAAVTFLAGFARGLSGFGVGLMMMPVTAYFYSQQIAVPLITLLDAPVAFILLYSVWGQFNWHEVSRLFVYTLIGIPAGIWILLYVDPYTLRLTTSAVILIVAIAMLSGLQTGRSNSRTKTRIIGFMAGFMEGSMSLPGPPIILGWVAAKLDNRRLRANIILYFCGMIVVAIPAFWFSGLYTREAVNLSLTLMPVFGLAALIGARSFHLISETHFSRIILGLIIFGAVSSLFG